MTIDTGNFALRPASLLATGKNTADQRDGTISANAESAILSLFAGSKESNLLAERNNSATLSANAPTKSLADFVNEAITSRTPQDTIQVSEEAQAALNTTATSQNMEVLYKKDATTTALGNTVDVET
jgi:hypothetical protein